MSFLRYVRKKNKRGNLSFNLLFASVLFLALDKYLLVLAPVRLPSSHHPTFQIVLELPSTPDDVHRVGTQVPKLGQIIYEAHYKIMALAVQELCSVLLFHRLLKTKFPRRKKGLLSCYACILMMVMASQLLVYLWCKVMEDPGRLTDDETKHQLNFLIIMISKLKWLSQSIVLLFLAAASFRHFCDGALPASLWDIPTFIGNKNQMLPTVHFFAGSINLVAVIFSSNMRHMLGLMMELTRLGVVLSGLYCLFDLAPYKFQRFLNNDGDGGGDDGDDGGGDDDDDGTRHGQKRTKKD